MQSCGPPGIEFETNDLEAFASEFDANVKNMIAFIYLVQTDSKS